MFMTKNRVNGFELINVLNLNCLFNKYVHFKSFM